MRPNNIRASLVPLSFCSTREVPLVPVLQGGSTISELTGSRAALVGCYAVVNDWRQIATPVLLKSLQRCIAQVGGSGYSYFFAHGYSGVHCTCSLELDFCRRSPFLSLPCPLLRSKEDNASGSFSGSVTDLNARANVFS